MSMDGYGRAGHDREAEGVALAVVEELVGSAASVFRVGWGRGGG